MICRLHLNKCFPFFFFDKECISSWIVFSPEWQINTCGYAYIHTQTHKQMMYLPPIPPLLYNYL